MNNEPEWRTATEAERAKYFPEKQPTPPGPKQERCCENCELRAIDSDCRPETVGDTCCDWWKPVMGQPIPPSPAEPMAKPDELVEDIIKEIFYDAVDVGESTNGATITDTGVSGYKDKLLAWALKVVEIDREELAQALARGYCYPSTEKEVLNPTLLSCMIEGIIKVNPIKLKTPTGEKG